MLSWNRNFEGHIRPLNRANYFATPALVVTYAWSGIINIDFENDPLGTDKSVKIFYLKDNWPSIATNQKTVSNSFRPDTFSVIYNKIS